jgi:hypothetical protein
LESARQPRRAPTRIWIRLSIAAGIVVGLVVLTFVAIVVTGAVRESRALEAVRARGEPLSPREIPFPASSQESDLFDRIQHFRTLHEDGVHIAYLGSTTREEFLADLHAAPDWAGAVERVEQFLECSRDDTREFLAWEKEVDARLADPRHARGLAECDRRLVLARAATAEPVLESARAVCSARPESSERVCRAWEPSDGIGPDVVHSAVLVGHAVQVLSDVAIARALEGRMEEAQELLGLAFRGANLMRDWPWYAAFSAWQFAIWNALDGLQTSMPALPVDVDLTEVERELESLDVEGQMRRAFIGERAFGNEMYAALRDGRLAGSDGSTVMPIRGPTDIFVWSWIGHDRAFYLERMGQGIAWASRTLADVVDEMAAARTEMESSFPGRHSLLAVMLIPSMDRTIQSAAHLRARVHLARAAIQARWNGTEAGVHAVSALPDPFRAGSLQSRIEADGTLVLWSIGQDFVDNRGTDDSLEEGGVHDEQVDSADIVWRVTPR